MNRLESVGKASFTVKEIAARNSVHVSTVNRWIATNSLKSLLIGRCRRIPVEAEKEFLDSHRH
jgi:excisionase family DNA binding protein